MSNSLPIAMVARTKIIATVGPACREPAQLKELVEAGTDVFRLNMAHGEIDQHAAVMKRIRDLSRQLNQSIATLVDLAGPKIRLGEIPGGMVQCNAGAESLCPRRRGSQPWRVSLELRKADRRTGRGRSRDAGRWDGGLVGHGAAGLTSPIAK